MEGREKGIVGAGKEERSDRLHGEQRFIWPPNCHEQFIGRRREDFSTGNNGFRTIDGGILASGSELIVLEIVHCSMLINICNLTMLYEWLERTLYLYRLRIDLFSFWRGDRHLHKFGKKVAQIGNFYPMTGKVKEWKKGCRGSVDRVLFN